MCGFVYMYDTSICVAHAYVSVHIYMDVSISACACIYIYAHTHLSKYTCRYIRISIYVYIYTHTHAICSGLKPPFVAVLPLFHSFIAGLCAEYIWRSWHGCRGGACRSVTHFVARRQPKLVAMFWATALCI